jgi:phage-related protein
MKPIGGYIAAGIGKGAAGYDFSADAATIASALESALNTALAGRSLSAIGVSAMNGLAAGISAGRLAVISAMRSAARAVVNAAKAELQIRSPSRVFRDEVGAMAMRGFGEGALRETKEQAKAVRNAARYLTDAAQEGVTGNPASSSRTYNQNSTVNLNVQSMTIRDEQDIRSLAIEIASLTKRQQRGKGLRMA